VVQKTPFWPGESNLRRERVFMSEKHPECPLYKERVFMSEKHPECPLYNPLNCKEYYNPKLCAFVRKDKDCLKKKKPKAKAKSSA
jgi:hypothetical protein